MSRSFVRPLQRPLITALLLMTLAPAWGQDRERQREAYGLAILALQRDDAAAYQDLRRELRGYPLAPYLDVAQASRQLARAGGDLPAVAVREALERHGALPPAWRLRRAWLRRLADQRRWSDYLADYRPQRDVELRCHRVNAAIQTGPPAPLEQDLWLAGESQPDACDPVFAHWKDQELLTPELYWQRAQLAAAAGNGRLARYLARRLVPEQRGAIDRWVRLRQNPDRQLKQAEHWADSEVNRKMLFQTLKSMASRSNDRARVHWRRLTDRFSWTEGQAVTLERDLALYYATDYPTDAAAELAAIPAAGVDDQILHWRIRVGVRNGDWDEVLNAFDGLSSNESVRPRWRYWQARALQALGQDTTAQFGELARDANYYGYLSASRENLAYPLCPRMRDPDSDIMMELARIPALRRSIELYHVGELTDARREWNTAMRGLDGEQRRQAALLASAEGWHGRAVLTLADTGHRQRYQLRFPLAWPELVNREASRFGLSPSLIWSVMRSESAMVTDAVSGAGAYGLMQLTPDTAQRVARGLALSTPSRRSLLKPEVNVPMGSAYLSELVLRFGHPLKALAAYNAGPEAVVRWESLGLPNDADRWIETVPYYETRDYLARVLAFATIYDWRRGGRMIPIHQRMPPMDSRSTGGWDVGGVVPRCAEAGE